MLKATKANRVLRIANEQKETYLKLGYTITNMDDSLVEEPPSFSHEVAELKKENEALKAENVELKAKLAAQDDSAEDEAKKAVKQRGTAKGAKAAP